jgi:hypothetical protein
MKAIMFPLLLSLSLSAVAQHHKDDNKDKKDRFMPLITRGIGGSFQKFDGINGRVAGLPQYKQLKDYTATLSLGWIKEYNHFITGADAMIGSSMSGDRDSKSSTIRYIGAGFYFGYNVLNSNTVMLYPLAGLGFQKYQARFFKDNTAVDFNNVLTSSATQNNIRPVDFKNSFVNYRLGFGLAFKNPKYPSNSIGLQATYTGGFKSHAWRSSDDQTLSNSPEDKLTQFNVGLIFTAAPWFMMKHEKM